MQTIQHLTVSADHIGQRLDNYLLSKLKGLPKDHLYRIIRKGEVRINKKRIKPNYRLQESDIIRVPPLYLSITARKSAPTKKLAILLEKSILFEDKNILVINKPAGLSVHGGSGIQLGLIEALRALRPQQKYLELAHRLDKETSGCLLLAKKSGILREIHSLFREGFIKKTYLALVIGHWPKALKKIDVALHKNQLQSGERVVRVYKEGKPALTHFRPIKYFSETTLIEATLVTGRTHQIRVHTQYTKHPIVGDAKYGDKLINKKMGELVGCKRLFLHANELSFNLPSTGQHFALKALLPKELESILSQLISK